MTTLYLHRIEGTDAHEIVAIRHGLPRTNRRVRRWFRRLLVMIRRWQQTSIATPTDEFLSLYDSMRRTEARYDHETRRHGERALRRIK